MEQQIPKTWDFEVRAMAPDYQVLTYRLKYPPDYMDEALAAYIIDKLGAEVINALKDREYLNGRP